MHTNKNIEGVHHEALCSHGWNSRKNHRDKPYEILRIQQKMLTGISKECLNMLAADVKRQTPEYFGIL